MYETKEGRKSKAEFYVSVANGGVYPAMRNVPGYEDDNPADWRVATADEIEAHKAGKVLVGRAPLDAVPLDAPVGRAAPTSIKLADDDEPSIAPQAVLQQAAAALPVFPTSTTTEAPSPPPAPVQFNGIPGAAPSAFPGFDPVG